MIKNIKNKIFIYLEKKPYFSKVLKNFRWLLLDKIIRIPISLAVGIWMARYLGPDNFGSLNYAIAFVALFHAFSNCGLDSIVIREILHFPHKSKEILGTGFFLRCNNGFISFLLCTFLIFFLKKQDTEIVFSVWILALGNFFYSFNIFDLWFQSQLLSKYSVMASGIAFLISSFFKFFFILKQAPFLFFAFACLLDVALPAFGIFLAYKITKDDIFALSFQKDQAKKMLRDSFPLILSGIVVTLYMKIDQLLLVQLIDKKTLGIYSVALRLCEIWNFIPAILLQSLYPVILESMKISKELFYERLQKFYCLMALVAYTIAFPVSIFSKEIISGLYGAQYSKAAPILSIYIWNIMFINLGLARGTFLVSVNWTKWTFITTLLGCIINIALNFILIPLYGGIGAAFAALISYWTAAHGACFFFSDLRPTGKMLFKAILFPIPFSLKQIVSFFSHTERNSHDF